MRMFTQKVAEGENCRSTRVQAIARGRV